MQREKCNKENLSYRTFNKDAKIYENEKFPPGALKLIKKILILSCKILLKQVFKLF